ncbi:MAG: hypothetical protein HUU20_25190 [Pirellulales bacterium]|nr:hypothetical protein [Pirellulales bacterium]
MKYAVCVIALCVLLPAATGSEANSRPRETVLFAFDDHSIPWRDNLKLTPVRADKHPANPVLRRGPEGAPDHGHAILYGSVIRIGDTFRMWYLAMGQTELKSGQAPGWWRPMCYAESRDGIAWTRPELGLVEYNGSRKNNICLVEGEPQSLTLVNDFLSVLYEPGDPDPARRYKVAYIAHPKLEEVRGGRSEIGARESRFGSMICATSADGLRWRIVGDRPANSGGERFEVSGLYRFGNFYYAPGQLISPWTWLPDGRDVGRAMLTYRSSDFASWSRAKALSFVRPGQTTQPPIPGQQTHMGAGIWNRGNVLVGLYGMWQDGPSQRPKGSSHLFGTRIDLGLVVSNDGVHFREPVPDFKVIARGGEDEWDSIALLQGHAFANVGDKTYLWYSHWDCEGLFRNQDIGLATLRRDGFGYLSLQYPQAPGHCVTSTVPALPQGASVYVNVEGATADHPLTVELLDEFDRPLPGYSGQQAAKLAESGVRQPVVWAAAPAPSGPKDRAFSVRAAFPASGNVRVYAIYVQTKQ